MSPHSHLAAQTWSPLATLVLALKALLYLRAWEPRIDDARAWSVKIEVPGRRSAL